VSPRGEGGQQTTFFALIVHRKRTGKKEMPFNNDAFETIRNAIRDGLQASGKEEQGEQKEEENVHAAGTHDKNVPDVLADAPVAVVPEVRVLVLGLDGELKGAVCSSHLFALAFIN
jgi:hypothetical protein